MDRTRAPRHPSAGMRRGLQEEGESAWRNKLAEKTIIDASRLTRVHRGRGAKSACAMNDRGEYRGGGGGAQATASVVKSRIRVAAS